MIFFSDLMKNRIVGVLILIIAGVIGFIVYSFNTALTEIVNASCSHGSTCPMWGTINFQTNVGLGIMAFVAIIGIYLIFFGQDEKIIMKIKKVKEKAPVAEPVKKDYTKILETLIDEEKSVFQRVIDSQGTIFQSDLVEKTGFPKAKVTRILDKLEGRGLVERRRRGMTNVVVLKQ
jgi:uncharacterized membrane protein